MSRVAFPTIVRSRRDLLAQYPALGAAGLGPHRLQDECIETIALFEDFAQSVARSATLLDRQSEPEASEALAEILDLACRRRIFSLVIPKSLGGSGYSMLALSLGLEQLSRVCVGIANVVAAHGLALALVGASGSLCHLRTLADRIVSGEQARRAFLLATAATEPSAGSDLEDFDALGRGCVESHADPTDDGYCLFGRKIYVSNGSLASAHVVVMPTDRARARDTLSAFLVFAGTPGLSIVRTEKKLGQRACPAAELLFDGCHLPREQRLNDRTIAGRTLDLVLGSSRATVGAFGAGIAAGVFETSWRLLRQLKGADYRALLEHPRARALLARQWNNTQLARNAYLSAAIVQHRSGLVSLMEAEPLRALDRLVPSRLTHAAWVNKLLAWGGIDREARRVLADMDAADVALASAFGAASKLSTSELALANCAIADELLGPRATREDSGLPKYLRDARLLSIYEGTSEICALDVTNKLLAEPA
jgi:acyl-CoA dehydrogenase